MARISERVSQAVSTVACPGCDRRVAPVIGKAPGAAPERGRGPRGDRRWSFIWRPPSGVVCPEGFFPLERLAQRMKWIHTASFGMILLIVGALTVLVRVLENEGAWLATVVRTLVWVGALALVVGVRGIVVEGRSGGPSTTA